MPKMLRVVKNVTWQKRIRMRCFTQDYQGSRPKLERGTLGSAVIAGGVTMKLSAIWFCGNGSMAKGASEDRLAHLLIFWRRTPGSLETACWQRWMTGLAGEGTAMEEGRGRGEGGEGGGIDWGWRSSSISGSYDIFWFKYVSLLWILPGGIVQILHVYKVFKYCKSLLN